MHSISSLIPEAVSRAKIGTQVDATRAIAAADEALKALFGENAKYARALSLKNGVLTVSCHMAALAQEIKLREREIAEHVNVITRKKSIERIRYLA